MTPATNLEHKKSYNTSDVKPKQFLFMGNLWIIWNICDKDTINKSCPLAN